MFIRQKKSIAQISIYEKYISLYKFSLKGTNLVSNWLFRVLLLSGNFLLPRVLLLFQIKIRTYYFVEVVTADLNVSRVPLCLEQLQLVEQFYLTIAIYRFRRLQ